MTGTKRALTITLVNEDKGYRFSEWVEPLSETIMGADATLGEIYRECAKEYGRCTGKIYVDTAEGTKHVGWYFVSRQRYEHDTDTYLRGAWVTVGQYHPAVPESVTYD